MNIIVILEILGHLFAMVTFLVTAYYAANYRRRIRRTIRRAGLVYYAITVTSAVFAVINLAYVVIALAAGTTHEPPWLDFISEYPSLIALSLIVIALINLRVYVENGIAHPKRILAIGAHPDDIEIACGGTVAKLRDAKHTIWGIVLTHGEQGGNGMMRPSEALRGAEFLGLDKLYVMDFPDTRLQERTVEITKAIEQVITEFKPDVILTHSKHDLHQDHQTVHEATLRAARRMHTILCYESPSVTAEFQPTFFVNIDQYLDVKIESVKEHWDQHQKPYMQDERVRGLAIYRGGQARCRFAEAFEVVRMCVEDVR